MVAMRKAAAYSDSFDAVMSFAQALPASLRPKTDSMRIIALMIAWSGRGMRGLADALDKSCCRAGIAVSVIGTGHCVLGVESSAAARLESVSSKRAG